MAYPENLLYTKSHEWLREEAGIAVIGITSYAIEQLGDIVFLELPEENSQIQRDERFGEIESTKTVSDLVAPVNGEVVAANRELVDQLDRFETSPYDQAWLIRVKVADASEFEGLLDAKQYAAHVESEED